MARRTSDVLVNGDSGRTNDAAAVAIIPPVLCGIGLDIAWRGRKCHSGTMWGGVTGGFAST